MNEYDFSFLSLLLSYIFYAFAVTVVLSSIYSPIIKFSEDLIINAFSLQSIIIVLAFVSPSFRDAIRIFKDESQLLIAD
ncbi:hypothetical protein, partial [Halorubrum ezzemoulense]|uniref:hypothetical protein n=1 Tax=Halorubrum ezzemoulense TaxID=337243 RepID=UPI00232AA8FE